MHGCTASTSGPAPTMGFPMPIRPLPHGLGPSGPVHAVGIPNAQLPEPSMSLATGTYNSPCRCAHPQDTHRLPRPAPRPMPHAPVKRGLSRPPPHLHAHAGGRLGVQRQWHACERGAESCMLQGVLGTRAAARQQMYTTGSSTCGKAPVSSLPMQLVVLRNQVPAVNRQPAVLC